MPQVHKPKVLNPKSRKAARKIKKVHQKERINLKHKVTNSKQSLILSKVIWFKNQLVSDNEKKHYSVDDIHELVSNYLKRFDSEEQSCETNDNGCLIIDHSVSMNVDMTRMFVSQESNEYSSSGLVVPDLSSKARVEQLRNWVVDKDKMQQIQMVKVRQRKNKVDME